MAVGRASPHLSARFQWYGMKYASLKNHADPNDEQKLRFKRPLWLRINGRIGVLLFLLLTVATAYATLSEPISRHQPPLNWLLSWLLWITFFVLPFPLMAWG